MKEKYIVGLLFLLACAVMLYAHSESEKNVFASVHKGDSRPLRFSIHNAYTYKDSDLTGQVITFVVKKNKSDSTYIMEKECTNQTQSGDTKGKCYVILSKDDTTYEGGVDSNDELSVGTYYAYVILENEGGTTKNTLLESKWILLDPS